MAEIAVSFTDDSKNYQQVLFQRGRPWIDGEGNEVGRLIRIPFYRKGILQDMNAGEAATKYGLVRAHNIEIVPGAVAGEVDVKPITGFVGYIEFRGYLLVLYNSVTLAGVAVPNPGADEYYQVYITLQETEISSAIDSTIEVEQLGETARRIGATMTIALGAANTDACTAANTASDPYAGGTKAGLLALVLRENGVAGAVAQYEIMDRWLPIREFQNFTDRNIFFGRAAKDEAAYFAYTAGALAMINVAMYLPGRVSAAGADPLILKLPTAATLSTDGDALVMRMPSRRAYGSSAAATQLDFTTAGPIDPVKGALFVESWGDWVQEKVGGATVEDGFADKVIIGVRLSASEFMLRTGQIIRKDPTGYNLPGEGKVYVGSSNLACETIQTDDGDVAGSNSADETPLMRNFTVPQAGAYKALFETRVGDGAGNAIFARVYSVRNAALVSGLAITYNAQWDGTNGRWKADDATDPSYIIRLGGYIDNGGSTERTIFEMASRSKASADPWNDNAWDVPSGLWSTQMDGLGGLTSADLAASIISGFRRLTLSTTSQPIAPATAITASSLYEAATPKGWGHVSSDGGGGTTDTGGMGEWSSAINGTNIRITMAKAMSNVNNYVVMTAAAGSATFVHWTVVKISSTIFELEAKDAAGVNIDLSANAQTCFFMVVGEHN